MPPSLPDDPRLSPETVRECGRVTLVGTVHDHPASVYRARAVTAAVDPDVLALELPPLAVPLYVQYASDGDASPGDGGEMSAAIDAAPDADVVGVDAPDRGFLRVLARRVVRDPPSASTLRGLGSGLASVTRHAVACRVAAALGRGLDGDDREFDCSRADPPAAQADDERGFRERGLALARSFGRPRSVELRDELREKSVARHLRALAGEGRVVAVVGVGHLDELDRRLDG